MIAPDQYIVLSPSRTGRIGLDIHDRRVVLLKPLLTHTILYETIAL